MSRFNKIISCLKKLIYNIVLVFLTKIVFEIDIIYHFGS